MPRLSLAQIELNMSKISGWRLNGNQIERVVSFADFAVAIDFVNRVAELATKANHHPELLIQFNKVKLTLTTHDEGGLTGKDFTLAQKINKLMDK